MSLGPERGWASVHLLAVRAVSRAKHSNSGLWQAASCQGDSTVPTRDACMCAFVSERTGTFFTLCAS